VTTSTEGVRPRLRALSLGEILDVSIKICLAHWRTLIKAVLIVVVPVQIVTTILTADYTVSSFDLSAGSSHPSDGRNRAGRHVRSCRDEYGGSA